jgi:spore maturation protein CgeB
LAPVSQTRVWAFLGETLKITIFGLTLSSSWGNGHATPYRAILRALHRQGAEVTFFEKDVPYYAVRRDFSSCPYCDLVLYSEWSDVRRQALECAQHSDVVITASYCPGGAQINEDVLNLEGPLRVFYDLDTPITVENLKSGPLDYLWRDQIAEFDLYLSFTGGRILSCLELRFGARLACPLYGCVDPDVYFRVPVRDEFACSLSYMGTYAEDRQPEVEELFLGPARKRRDLRFTLAGSMYPASVSWPDNVCRYDHVAPQDHSALYSSSRATLNITRRTMAESGFCPSGRFFEAAACGTPILTDWWQGLDSFFDVSREISVIQSTDDVLFCLDGASIDLMARARRARERTLDQYTGWRRAQELLAYCEEASRGRRQLSGVAD